MAYKLYVTDTVSFSVPFEVVTWHESGLLFTPKKGGTRPRVQPVFSIIHHTSGGETLPKDFHRNISSRPTRDKRGYSSHLYTTYEGVVYQMAPFDTITRHAGILNAVSIGNEFQNRLFNRDDWPAKWVRDYPRGVYVGEVHGKKRSFLMLSAAQIEVGIQLTNHLCDEFDIPYKIAGVTRGKNRMLHNTVIETPEHYRGVLAHYNCAGTKVDPGPQFFEALRDEDYTCSLVR